MSKQNPVWGIDVHSEYQRGLDFKRVASKDEGYAFAVIKFSQGAGYVPAGTVDYFKRAEASGLVVGGYHFLDSTAPGADQARHFMTMVKSVGGHKGKLIAVDFENYDPAPPSNKHLKDFMVEIRKHIGDYPIILYTNKGFWEAGHSSGDFSQYGADALWVARYANMVKHGWPGRHYRDILGWSGAWESVGGKASDFWQFTSTGHVAGQYIDVNAFDGTLDDLKALTSSETNKNPPPTPTDKGSKVCISNLRPKQAESIAKAHRKLGREVEVTHEEREEEMSKVQKGLAKALEYKGVKYGFWTWQRNFVLWANAPLPSRQWALQNGGVCSSVPNVYRIVNGMDTPAPNGKLKGGTAAWFAAHAHHRLTDLDKSYPAGTLFMSDYRGEAVNLQGHVAVAGETNVNPWLYQADVTLGFNDQRRLRDTQQFAGFTHYALPGEWIN